MYEQAPDILDALAIAKELNAGRLALADKMIKISNEILELNTRRGTAFLTPSNTTTTTTNTTNTTITRTN